MVDNNGQQTFSVINTEMAVRAMRDSGYKSTTHALAELIDNSVEANATDIELFGLSQFDPVAKRRNVVLKELAILDNGDGMDAETLRSSLRYGSGTRIRRKGIGRFGLGLPNSSMSQAQRVDVWSWQSGVANALHTWLSVDAVKEGMGEIPEPTLEPLPKQYIDNTLIGVQDSGTLVVWSDLDKVQWTRASTVFKHTENLIGRIYRRFLSSYSDRLHVNDNRGGEIGQKRSITLIPLKEENGFVQTIEENIVYVAPNDPLYLMSGTSCPELFGSGPMFEELSGSPFIVPIKYKGQEFKVRIRASYARPHVRDSSHPDADWPRHLRGLDAGRTEWGKHAASNMGVSIMRAHREIDIDSSWTNSYTPEERWWTVEVDFPTALDEIFGVTINKQGTMNFQKLSDYDWRREALDGEESAGDVRRRMIEDGDTRVPLLDIKKQIDNCITTMRKRVKKNVHRRGKRHTDDENAKADAKVTAAIERRVDEGSVGTSDIIAESGTQEEHQKIQMESLIEKHHFDEPSARKIVEVGKDNKVRVIVSSQSTPAFFDVEPFPNVIQVVLNDEHPVYSHLYELLHPEPEEIDQDEYFSEDEMRTRLAKATAAFHILIYAWARYEDEQTDKAKRAVRNSRIEWGKYAEEFFDEDDGNPGPISLV